MTDKDRELSRQVSASKDAWRAGGETGKLRMSPGAFHSIHPDFRSKRGDSSHPSCLVLGQGGTALVAVEFTKGAGS